MSLRERREKSESVQGQPWGRRDVLRTRSAVSCHSYEKRSLRLSHCISALMVGVLLPLGCESPKASSGERGALLPLSRSSGQDRSRSKRPSPSGHDRSRSKLPPIDYSRWLGLPNLGNTCFANAAHKLLWAHPGMLDFLEKREKEEEERGNANRAALLRALFELLQGLSANHKALLQSRTPQDYGFEGESNRIFELGNKIGVFRGEQITVQQQDPHEYLMGVFDGTQYDDFFQTVWHGHKKTAEGGEELGGYHRAFILSLYINEGIASVQDALDASLKPDEEQRLYLFAKEKDKPIQKQWIFQLARYRWAPEQSEGEKNKKEIEVSQEVKIPVYTCRKPESGKCELLSPKSQEYTYEVKAVVCHEGGAGINRGHYVAYVLMADANNNERWFRHDDRGVHPVSKEDASVHMKKTAYLLLYTLRES